MDLGERAYWNIYGKAVIMSCVAVLFGFLALIHKCEEKILKNPQVGVGTIFVSTNVVYPAIINKNIDTKFLSVNLNISIDSLIKSLNSISNKAYNINVTEIINDTSNDSSKTTFKVSSNIFNRYIYLKFNDSTLTYVSPVRRSL